MKIILLFILIVILALIESVVYPVPLILYLCIGWMIAGLSRPFLLAFLAGILVGFISHREIGYDSFYFLLSVFLIFIYRRRILTHTLYYLVPYTMLVTLIYRFIVFRSLEVTWVIISLLSAFTIYGILVYIANKFKGRENLSYAQKA